MMRAATGVASELRLDRFERYPLRSRTAGQWIRVLESFGVPRRHVLLLYPADASARVERTPLERELLAASQQVWDALRSGADESAVASEFVGRFRGLTFSTARDRTAHWVTRGSR